jgi:hypothetical protein
LLLNTCHQKCQHRQHAAVLRRTATSTASGMLECAIHIMTALTLIDADDNAQRDKKSNIYSHSQIHNPSMDRHRAHKHAVPYQRYKHPAVSAVADCNGETVQHISSRAVLHVSQQDMQTRNAFIAWPAASYGSHPTR